MRKRSEKAKLENEERRVVTCNEKFFNTNRLLKGQNLIKW